MTDAAAAEPPASELPLPERLAGDLDAIEKELGEIDLLVEQATTEAGRHEARRAAAAEKASRAARGGTDPAELNGLYEQLMTLTKRAALMESQVEVLEGKRRALTRYRDALASYVDAAGAAPASPATARSEPSAVDGGVLEGVPPAVARLLLTTQEDLRRDIARAMHDGPAQSLTNIVLQAQIVERLVTADPQMASGEVRQLIAMVQQTLEATKSFIFDVRPMVLDDLGLVATLRRAARDRGRRAGVAVEFDSVGVDRRLPMEIESGLFRILDEALTAYLALGPDRVTVKLDWGDGMEARVTAIRGAPEMAVEGTPEEPSTEKTSGRKGRGKAAELPPALAAMIEERRADERDAAEAARLRALVVLPASTWREIESRARTLGLEVELLGEGSELRVAVDLTNGDRPEAE